MLNPVEKVRLPTPTLDSMARLLACLSPASFWSPEQIGPEIAWLEHAPFAFWLVEALRPGLLVELGTHGGFSYFSLCQAVHRLGLDSRCYAVDTWKGDEHAGFYGEEVFRQVNDHNRQYYSAFSTLIRSSFDDALPHFSDSSIDLLHVDGRHRYEDVEHDFSTWRGKLSERAVVMFHDTNVRERDFGVHRLWRELSDSLPHFEFLHGNGLGVVGLGADLPEHLRILFSLAEEPEATTHLRNSYARLGSAVTLQFKVNKQAAAAAEAAALRQELALHAAEQARLREHTARQADEIALHAAEQTRLRQQTVGQAAEIARHLAELTRLRKQAAQPASDVAALQAVIAERNGQIAHLEGRLAAVGGELDRVVAQHAGQAATLQQVTAARDALNKEVAALRSSTSWRLTGPLRRARRLLVRPSADDANSLRAAHDSHAAIAAQGVGSSPDQVRTLQLAQQVDVLRQELHFQTDRVDYALAQNEGCAELMAQLESARVTKAYWEPYRKTAPLVSVCVATSDRAELLIDRCIRSLRDQT
jgi:hypothetical protein